MTTSILIYGKDPVLLETRCKVLELAGLRCHTVTDLDNAVTAVAKERIGVVVLCSSIPTQEVSEALSLISEVSRGRLKTIVVTLPDTSLPEGDAIALVESPAEPRQFIELVTRTISA